MERQNCTATAGARILRPDEARRRLGLGRTAFRENFVVTDRLHKLQLGKRAIGYLESEVETLVAEMVEEAKARAAAKATGAGNDNAKGEAGSTAPHPKANGKQPRYRPGRRIRGQRD